MNKTLKIVMWMIRGMITLIVGFMFILIIPSVLLAQGITNGEYLYLLGVLPIMLIGWTILVFGLDI